jgi:hypothetical protein
LENKKTVQPFFEKEIAPYVLDASNLISSIRQFYDYMQKDNRKEKKCSDSCSDAVDLFSPIILDQKPTPIGMTANWNIKQATIIIL